MRIFTVTGTFLTPNSVVILFEVFTALSKISLNKSCFQGRAAPPPFLVTLGTGHPIFKSI